jgi:hypothetical protein
MLMNGQTRLDAAARTLRVWAAYTRIADWACAYLVSGTRAVGAGHLYPVCYHGSST